MWFSSVESQALRHDSWVSIKTKLEKLAEDSNLIIGCRYVNRLLTITSSIDVSSLGHNTLSLIKYPKNLRSFSSKASLFMDYPRNWFYVVQDLQMKRNMGSNACLKNIECVIEPHEISIDDHGTEQAETKTVQWTEVLYYWIFRACLQRVSSRFSSRRNNLIEDIDEYGGGEYLFPWIHTIQKSVALSPCLMSWKRPDPTTLNRQEGDYACSSFKPLSIYKLHHNITYAATHYDLCTH
ncbi:hypothetical protein Bca4012_027426 [Brassica carinata]